MVKINFLDIEMGILGGVGMAFSIFLINLTGGLYKAVIAASIQLVYSFLVITFTTNLCRKYCRKSIVAGVTIPSIFTTVLTYLIHFFANSPEPFWSAAFAFVIAVPSFIIMSCRFRVSKKSLLDFIKELFKL